MESSELTNLIISFGTITLGAFLGALGNKLVTYNSKTNWKWAFYSLSFVSFFGALVYIITIDNLYFVDYLGVITLFISSICLLIFTKKFLDKNDPKPGKRGGENKSNITDNESAKMASSHGVVQGYNGMALTDAKHQIVVSADAFGNVCENEYLDDMIEAAKENFKRLSCFGLGVKKAALLADTNYFSEDNCRYTLKNGIDAYIPDHGFRLRDPRYPENKDEQKKRVKYRQEDFMYFATGD